MEQLRQAEIYAILVHMSNGEKIEGYVQRGADTEKGLWLVISRSPELNEASYLNRSFITHFDLAEIK